MDAVNLSPVNDEASVPQILKFKLRPSGSVAEYPTIPTCHVAPLYDLQARDQTSSTLNKYNLQCHLLHSRALTLQEVVHNKCT